MAKRLSKAQLNKKLVAQEVSFVECVKAFAIESHYPWYEDDPEVSPDLETQNFKKVLGM